MKRKYYALRRSRRPASSARTPSGTLLTFSSTGKRRAYCKAVPDAEPVTFRELERFGYGRLIRNQIYNPEYHMLVGSIDPVAYTG